MKNDKVKFKTEFKARLGNFSFFIFHFLTQ